MKLADEPTVEITSDINTVWVNNARCCIGRFGRMGVDVHWDIDEHTGVPVDKAGVAQRTHCACCVPGEADEAKWRTFQRAMLDYHDVEVGDEHMPVWAQTSTLQAENTRIQLED